MGRPEKPITSDGPVAELAKRLRALRLAAAVGDNHVRNYKSMAARVGMSASTLSQAASGDKLPTWRVTRKYLEACDVTDEEEIVLVRKEWEFAAAEVSTRRAPAGPVPPVPVQRPVPGQVPAGLTSAARREDGSFEARGPARAERAPASTATHPPEQAWQYRWDITLTWRSEQDSPTGQAREHYLTASDPDELAEIVLRTSFDPRVVAYRYERHAALDMSGAPKSCPDCQEPFDTVVPQQWWTPCNCGGHMTYQCVMCGDEQIYPELNITCL
jgi:transcriptional regulator with XRE-family HTH domain